MAFTQLATTCQTGTMTGSKAVTAGATSVTVAISANTATYSESISPNWNTTWWVSGKTASQFVVNFGTPAPGDNTGLIYWSLTGV